MPRDITVNAELSSRYLPYILARIEWKLHKLRGDVWVQEWLKWLVEGMMGDVCNKKSHEKDVFLKMLKTCLDNC